MMIPRVAMCAGPRFLGYGPNDTDKDGPGDVPVMPKPVCPVCGKDPNEVVPGIRDLCMEAGMDGEVCNPGGRALHFSSKGENWLQLSDQCTWCDAEKIREFLQQE